MFIKFRLAIMSLVYLIGLELISFRPDLIVFILALLLLAAVFETLKNAKKIKFSILPIFFIIFSIGLLRLIALLYEQQIFILLCSIMYYLLTLGNYRLHQYSGDQTARGMVMAGMTATIFFVFTASYGFYLNFAVPLYVLMLVCLASTFLISYQYFSIVNATRLRIALYSFILGLVMAEIIWTMNFWPFGYLTTGVVALILYYVLWDLAQSYFLNLLSRKRVVANMLFFSLMITMVLLTAKWIPVI